MFICTTNELTFTSRKSESSLQKSQGSETSRSYTRLSLPTQNTGSHNPKQVKSSLQKGQRKKKQNLDKKSSTKKRRRMLYLLPSFVTDWRRPRFWQTEEIGVLASNASFTVVATNSARAEHTREESVLRGASALGSLWLQALASSSDGQEVVMIGSDGNKKRRVVVGDGAKASSG
jgi:predicted Zn-dependent protease